MGVFDMGDGTSNPCPEKNLWTEQFHVDDCTDDWTDAGHDRKINFEGATNGNSFTALSLKSALDLDGFSPVMGYTSGNLWLGEYIYHEDVQYSVQGIFYSNYRNYS